MPKKGILKFQHYNRSIKVPLVVYADFEAFTQKISLKRGSSTEQYQKHQPSGFCYKIVGLEKKTELYRAKGDENIGEKFVEMLEKDIRQILQKHNLSKKMDPLTKKEQKDFDSAKVCWICQKALGRKRARDHDHFTGKYRGAAHTNCNLQFKKPDFVPVFFHNLSGYDSHLFVKNLGKTEGEIRCIPNNDEKYISFSKEIIVGKYVKNDVLLPKTYEIRFIDSFKFMSSSLSGLVENLKKSGLEKFVYLEKEFREIELLTRKGVYPYDYMDGIEKFSEQLPPQKEFYSKLNDCGISDEDYEHAQKIWKEFEIQNMGEYHDLYLKTDVLLLADVFEEFRKICMENYSLDPAWYYTSPGLSWDALLKHSKVQLELLSDLDMLLLFEKGIRGGVSMIPNRWGKANNKFMGDSFDKTKPSKFLAYLDANNLYGWAMMQPLPVGDFHWMNEEELKNWKDYPCILEVDLDYPKKLT